MRSLVSNLYRRQGMSFAFSMGGNSEAIKQEEK